MEKPDLKDFFSHLPDLDSSFINHLEEQFEEVEFPKNFQLFKEGKVSHKVWLIKKGVVGYFFLGREKEHLAWIDMEGEVVGSIRSIASMLPANETARLLEDSVLYELDFRELEKAFSDAISFERIKSIVYQDYFFALEERVRMLQSMDAKERYRQLMEQKPELLQRVSLQHIASFLGVTPETLSRIRADFS